MFSCFHVYFDKTVILKDYRGIDWTPANILTLSVPIPDEVKKLT